MMLSFTVDYDNYDLSSCSANQFIVLHNQHRDQNRGCLLHPDLKFGTAITSKTLDVLDILFGSKYIRLGIN